MGYTREERIKKLQNLPSLAFRHRQFLPDVPVVYFVLDDGVPDVLYVGRTDNLEKRWKAHHRAPQMHDHYRIYWLLVVAAHDRVVLERVFINGLNPHWNRTECIPLGRV